jgi:hypothetical protein
VLIRGLLTLTLPRLFHNWVHKAARVVTLHLSPHKMCRLERLAMERCCQKFLQLPTVLWWVVAPR